MMDDEILRVRYFASTVGIWKKRVYNLMHQHLNKWVPRVYTVEQERSRYNCSNDNWMVFQRNSHDLSDRLFTV